MNPPVLSPASRQTRPAGSTGGLPSGRSGRHGGAPVVAAASAAAFGPQASSAASSFPPARLAHRGSSPMTITTEPAFTGLPRLVTTRPSTVTRPRSMKAPTADRLRLGRSSAATSSRRRRFGLGGGGGRPLGPGPSASASARGRARAGAVARRCRRRRQPLAETTAARRVDVVWAGGAVKTRDMTSSTASFLAAGKKRWGKTNRADRTLCHLALCWAHEPQVIHSLRPGLSPEPASPGIKEWIDPSEDLISGCRSP